MNRYLIGGLLTEVDAECARLERLGQLYATDKPGQPDIEIKISAEAMRRAQEKYSYLPPDEVAYMVTGSVFYHRAVQFNALLLHSSAIEVDGRAYCFSANSGTGKSTHTGLWQKYLGEQRVRLINDDKPLLRRNGEQFFACGTPWSGKTDLNRNVTVPLKAIVFIKRGQNNTVRPLTGAQAVPLLYEQTVKPKSPELMSAMLQTADELLRTVPVLELSCDMSEEAVRVSYEALSKL